MIVLFYFLVFLGLILEGEAVLFIAVFYTIKGFFEPLFIIPVIFTGVFVGDIFWFKYSFYIARHTPFLGRLVCRFSENFDNYLLSHRGTAFFISKFAYGLNHIAILRAGALKIPFKEFLKADAVASVLWMMIIGGIAYLSALTFDYFRHYLKIAEAGLLLGLLFLFFLTWLIARINRSRFGKFKKSVCDSSSLK